MKLVGAVEVHDALVRRRRRPADRSSSGTRPGRAGRAGRRARGPRPRRRYPCLAVIALGFHFGSSWRIEERRFGGAAPGPDAVRSGPATGARAVVPSERRLTASRIRASAESLDGQQREHAARGASVPIETHLPRRDFIVCVGRYLAPHLHPRRICNRSCYSQCCLEREIYSDLLGYAADRNRSVTPTIAKRPASRQRDRRRNIADVGCDAARWLARNGECAAPPGDERHEARRPWRLSRDSRGRRSRPRPARRSGAERVHPAGEARNLAAGGVLVHDAAC